MPSAALLAAPLMTLQVARVEWLARVRLGAKWMLVATALFLPFEICVIRMTSRIATAMATPATISGRELGWFVFAMVLALPGLWFYIRSAWLITTPPPGVNRAWLWRWARWGVLLNLIVMAVAVRHPAWLSYSAFAEAPLFPLMLSLVFWALGKSNAMKLSLAWASISLAFACLNQWHPLPPMHLVSIPWVVIDGLFKISLLWLILSHCEPTQGDSALAEPPPREESMLAISESQP